jgi:hypothetical protein
MLSYGMMLKLIPRPQKVKAVVCPVGLYFFTRDKSKPQ